MSCTSKDFQIPEFPELTRVELTTGKKYIAVIGDVHGCIDEFRQLVDVLPKFCTTYQVGDLVDRGPESKACLEFALEKGIQPVLGNHEERHIRYRRHQKTQEETGKKNPMKVDEDFLKVNESLSDELLSKAAKFPVIAYVPIYKAPLITHAGFAFPKIEGRITQPTKSLIRTRYISKATGRMLSLRECFNEEYVNWDENWQGTNRVIYGHNIWDEPRVNNNCIGIDTGCVYGKRLSAYVEDVKTHEHFFVSVDSSVNYEPSARETF